MFKMNQSVEEVRLENENYLGNFDNGVLVLLDEKRKRILERYNHKKGFLKQDFKDDPEFLEELKEGGFFEEITQPLATAYLHVTNICNLNCIGCYSFDRTRNCKDKLTLENVKHIIDELASNGVEMLTISGGEPLLRKDLEEILQYAKIESGIETINLITNGTIYDENRLLIINKYIDSLAVSIDGYSYDNPHFIRDEGTFPQVIDFVVKVRNLGMPVAILPTLHRKNIEAIGEYMKLSQQLGVPISFSLLTCSGELEDYIPTEENLNYLANYFMDYMKEGVVPLQDYTYLEAKKSCGAGSSIISITADGYVYPCHMMHDTDTVMGNIFESPLEQIMSNATKVPPVEEVEYCKECELRNVCGGGCKARALLINGSWSQPDPYCGLNRSFYKKYLEERAYYAKRKIL